jgi:hypothetical protein
VQQSLHWFIKQNTMKNILKNKLQSVQEKMNAMHYEHLYYLKDKWKQLKAQEDLLEELIAEAPEEAPEGFSTGVKAMLDELAATRYVKQGTEKEPAALNAVIQQATFAMEAAQELVVASQKKEEPFKRESLKAEILKLHLEDFKQYPNEERLAAFKADLEVADLEDTRASGFRCSSCKKYSIASVAFGQQDVVLYADITGNKKIILCNKHYCGCRGWE